MIDEGAIKFHADHEEKPLVARRFGAVACQLIAWREILGHLGLVGQDPKLYGGFGYGNVSGRSGPPAAPRHRRPFLITGTQTSGQPCISLQDFCLVERYDLRRNRVVSQGMILPSSESMTHGAIYDLGSHIRFVFHSHCPILWRHADRLRLPTTDRQVAYGTPEMGREVERLYRTTHLADVRILAMGGHEDGIVSFGRSAEEAGQVTLRYLAKAYELECAAAGGLCRV